MTAQRTRTTQRPAAVLAQAPTRVDLAGGTLDIHPLYLLEDDAWTVNVAVEIPVRVRVTRRRVGVVVRSEDLNVQVTGEGLDALPTGGRLDLACRALRHAAGRLGRGGGLEVTLHSAAPPGSGLGASSALLVALLAALDRLGRRPRRPDDLVAAAWRLEAASLRTLTGRQDYLAAVCGGVNAIAFGVDGDRIEPLLRRPGQRRALEERLVLAYTGQPHASGLTNWGVVRAYLDGSPRAVSGLRRIGVVARQVRDALRAGDLDAVGELIGEEWAHRRRLASGVSTPEIEQVLAVARRHGATGGKACGAGGGGCVLAYTRTGAKPAVERALRAAGVRVLETRVARRGLHVRTVRPR
ncbi:MAG: hypothetical protein QN183_06155 [Armatimonadota bacterium]|nr:hypothetical protein [Armatimonadota bacterium]MDR7532000.1 hypothetical protein [Armatimonadota bacterium]MDR7535931.1 hypothetical protein [Armatimonadota bacterium]